MRAGMFIFLLIQILPSAGWSEQNPAQAKKAYLPSAGSIWKVVVYADRAEVTRQRRAKCQGAATKVLFSGLPAGLDERTLKAEVLGGSQVVGLTSRLKVLDRDLNEQVTSLMMQIKKIENTLRDLELEKQGFHERETMINGYSAYFKNLLNEQVRSSRLDTNKWSTVLDTMYKERSELYGRQFDNQINTRDLNGRLQLLRRKLAYLQPREPAKAYEADVTVACQNDNDIIVRISYVIHGATWHPEYDLRFDLALKSKAGRGVVKWTVAAVVQQATGEDWNNVQITLSTAKPRLGSEAPYPAPLYIDGHKVDEKKVLVTTMEQREDLREIEKVKRVDPVNIEFEDQGKSFSLRAPGRVSVKADGRPYWIPLDVVKSQAASQLVGIPKMKPYVFHALSFSNSASYPLLAGRVHIYRNGVYMGDTRIDYKSSGENIELSLGVDEEIRLERKDLHEMDRSPGFLSRTRHIERVLRIIVKNRSTKRQKIVIKENIPVSKIEDVEVELVKDKTSKGYQLDGYRGFISWKIKLKPREEKYLDLAYTIHLPEGWKVE